MDTHEAIINPVMGKKPPHLGKRCVMVANPPDFDYLHRLLKTTDSQSRRILMSRLNFGYESTSMALAGPFIGAPSFTKTADSLSVATRTFCRVS